MTFPRKILVAIDFDDVSDGAFRAAIELARTTRARLCVMTAPTDAVTDRAATRDVAAVIERAGAQDMAVETHVERGATPDAIVRAASHVGADLIVVGTHVRSRMTAGASVAAALLRESHVPILVVPGSIPRS